MYGVDVDGVVILEILTVSCFCVEYPASIQSISYSSWQCVKSCGTKRVDSKSHLIKKHLLFRMRTLTEGVMQLQEKMVDFLQNLQSY